MGLCLSAEEKEQKEISQTIDRGLEEDNRRLKKECKILLLGNTTQNQQSFFNHFHGDGGFLFFFWSFVQKGGKDREKDETSMFWFDN